jgi:hypothetical protein
MGWDVGVYAKIALTPAETTRWKKANPQFVEAPAGFPKAQGKPPTTVDKGLALFAKANPYWEVHEKAGGVSLCGLLSKDEYLDLAPSLAAIVNAAAACGGRGELVFYGYVTAPHGIAYRLRLGKSLDKLSAADEKKITAGASAKAIDTWVQKRVEQEEQARIPTGNAAFFKGMTGVKPIVLKMMSWVQSADDKALVKAVQGERLYYFYPGDFKSGARVKKACRPDGKVFEIPWLAMRDVLRLIARLDATAAAGFARQICDAKEVPSSLWQASGEVLAATPDAPCFARAFLMRELDDLNVGVRGMREWAHLLAGNPSVPTALLEERFRELVVKAVPKSPGGYTVEDSPAGAGETAVYFAAALLLERQDWAMVPEIAAATFTHGNWLLRKMLGNLLAAIDLPVPVPAPTLDKLERGDRGALRNELQRRFKVDPRRAYDELAAQLEAGDYATRADVFLTLQRLKPEEQRALAAEDRRWAAWAAKHPGA